VDKWGEAGLGYPLPDLLGWSADGKYAYFYNSIIPDGCQPIGGFQQDLRQVDLTMGNIRSIPISWTGGMALSPDSTKVIYYDRQKAEVGIYDLAIQEEQRIPFELPKGMEDWFAGDFTWSPDGQMAVFIIRYGDACGPSGDYLRLVDLQMYNVRTLLKKENQSISIVEWTEKDRVLITIEGEKWWLDPASGSLSAP
jgi:hypothetical protein